jgi:hypothetical protein
MRDRVTEYVESQDDLERARRAYDALRFDYHANTEDVKAAQVAHNMAEDRYIAATKVIELEGNIL